MLVEHFGWPDHHPPPFEYIKPLLDSIHTHLKSNERATAVLHCKGSHPRLWKRADGSRKRKIRDDCSELLSYP